VLLVISPCIFQLKTLGQVVVDLYRSQLPTATYGIAHHEVELRSVESCFTIFHHRLESLFLSNLLDATLGSFPVGVRTDVFRWVAGVAKGNLREEVREIECLENVQHQIDHLPYFLFHLVDGAENVCIVLGESAHAGEAM
jgi:hypothetical protein